MGQSIGSLMQLQGAIDKRLADRDFVRSATKRAINPKVCFPSCSKALRICFDAG